MQPGNRLLDLAQLKDAWECFRNVGSVPPGMDFDPLVATSWQRCAPRLNPTGSPQWIRASPEVLPLLLNRHVMLRTITRPIMEDVYQFIEGSGAALSLLDSTN